MSSNDVVMIQLDRPRELRYGHKALKKLLAITGRDLESLDLQELDLDELEKYLYCGLLSDARENGETLELAQMEDLLDQAPSFSEMIAKMEAALEKAFPGAGGNVPGKSQAKKKPSTGKSG